MRWEELTKSPGARRWLGRNRGPRDQEILPGMYSFSSEYLKTMENIVRTLNDELPIDVTDEGFCGPSGIGADFNRGLSVSGYGMDPLPIPIMNNRGLLQERGISGGFVNERHEQIFNELVDEMFGYHKPSACRIRKEASTGIPFFTSDMDYKKDRLHRAFAGARDLLSAVGRRDWTHLLMTYDIVLAYAINERQQADSGSWDGKSVPVFKERLVPDADYARSGGEEGRLYPADKEVVIDGHKFQFHSAMRRRTVFGMSFVPNYFTSAVLGCIREVYLERFAFTWKHRSFEDMSAKAARFKYAIGFDVKNMDNNIPMWALKKLCDRLRNHLADEFVDLIERMYQAPFVMPNPFRERDPKYNPYYGKIPLTDDAFDLEVGLASGISINPDTGKFFMVFTYLCMMHDCGVDFSLVEMLQGSHPEAAMLNMSDDCVLLANTDSLREKATVYKSPYAILEPEVPAQFLGGVFMRESGGALKVVPNANTYFINFFVPERGINHPSRSSTWSLGYTERRHHYSTAPAFKMVDQVIESKFIDGFGVSPWILAQLHHSAQQGQGMSPVDEMVLNNPHYLHYRISPQDVSEKVLDLIVSSIPPEEFYESIRFIFKH